MYCDDIDDIVHFFLLCPKVANFQESFLRWCKNIEDLLILPTYNCLEIIITFGFQLKEIFFIAKYYIYNKRMLEDNNLDFFNFLYELKFKQT